MHTQNMIQVSQVIDIVDNYYRNEIGELTDIALASICFCAHNPECKVADHSPMTVPDVQNNCLKVHISSAVAPEWFPCQLLFQYSHELWHAYEFSQFGISYPWQVFQNDIEPYAYAASLCALSQRMIPSQMMADLSQKAYFYVTNANGPEKDIYKPGNKLAKEVDYDLEKLHSQYQRVIAPQILSPSA